MPFALRAVQVDGGSEFRATLEEVCQRRGWRLFFAAVALTQARRCGETRPTDAHREFYEIRPFTDGTVTALSREARPWEKVYNTIRPHEALAYKTPQ